MILFKDDWLKYPTAIADYSTRNKSFVEYSKLLARMGVKNNAWPLALINPNLVGLDPHSEDLTTEQKELIALECAMNPWYYFREVSVSPTIGGTVRKQLRANRGNMALFWSFFNHITSFLIQPRQTGKSFCTDTLMVYLMDVVCNNTQINLLTKDDKLRVFNLQRLKDIYECLPEYLKFKTPNDANNTEEFTIKARGNFYKTHVPRNNEIGANNLGRGLSTPILHCDEIPFQPMVNVALPAALGAMGEAIAQARSAKAPYGIIYTTTAGKLDTESGRYAYKIFDEGAVWDERYIDCADEAELRKTVCGISKSRDYLVSMSFTHRQLGYDDEWLLEQIRRTKSTKDEYERDFLNIWTSGTESHPLDKYLLGKISNSVLPHDHIDIDEKNGYVMKWYIHKELKEDFMQSGDFVLGLDTSDAIGKDYISMTLSDLRTLRTVATAGVNETNIAGFAMWVADFLLKYKNVTLMPERKSSATSMLDQIYLTLTYHNEDIFKRVFNKVVNDQEVYKDAYAELSRPISKRPIGFYEKHKNTFGYVTAGSGAMSRNELYVTTLSRATQAEPTALIDRTIIEQLKGITTRNGRLDHAVGGNDDQLISWMLGMWFVFNAKNTSVYGIRTRYNPIVSNLDKLSPEERKKKEDQIFYRKKIDELANLMKEESDDAVIQKYIQQLKSVERFIILEEGEIFSIEDLVNRNTKNKRESKLQSRMEHNRHNSSINPFDIHREYNRGFSFGNRRNSFR